MSFPFAAPEQSPPLTLGTPDQVLKKSSKGQEYGLAFSPPFFFLLRRDLIS